MTQTEASGTTHVDGIALELLRTRLQAIAEEAAITIERTATSVVITESRDLAASLMTGDGTLIASGGALPFNDGGACHAVRSTIALHGGEIVPGDIFLGNDPHNGGGMHAQDVVVQRPVFYEGRIVAWVTNTGHMTDMGGMTFGSWSPTATECYQEAIRFPPVRLFAGGVEQRDIWAIVRNNVRMSHLIEMDMRALVAACNVGHDKLLELIESMGIERFEQIVDELVRATERELRRRIGLLEDGEYRFDTWTEWDDGFYRVPCRMTVAGDRLIFDFEGASPQTDHFFNSKQYIIEANVVAEVTNVIGYDLPMNGGLYAPVDVRCPQGTIVDCVLPAPIASSHLDVAVNAATAAQQCLMMALAVSGEVPGRHLLCGPSSPSALGMHTWSYTTDQGYADGWLSLDGAMTGGGGGNDRDGNDFANFMVAKKAIIEAIDVEMFESTYPALVIEKRPRAGGFGSGRFRSGAGSQMTCRPHGTDRWVGALLGMRERLPLPGVAGGFPGANTVFQITRRDGRVERVSGHANGLVLEDGESFTFACASSGGWGDPLAREPKRVADDVRLDRLTTGEAADAYGVVVGHDGEVDAGGTATMRGQVLQQRLRSANPAPTPIAPASVPPSSGNGAALYHGIVQEGAVAYAAASGAPLAVAPDSWTEGCPWLEQRIGTDVVMRTYLDPSTGHTLLVDVMPEGEQRTIDCRPARWVEAQHVRAHQDATQPA
jgi:N-methylhydantoinase B